MKPLKSGHIEELGQLSQGELINQLSSQTGAIMVVEHLRTTGLDEDNVNAVMAQLKAAEEEILRELQSRRSSG